MAHKSTIDIQQFFSTPSKNSSRPKNSRRSIAVQNMRFWYWQKRRASASVKVETKVVGVETLCMDEMCLFSGWTVTRAQRRRSGQLFRHDGDGLGPPGSGHVHDEAHLLPDTAKQASRETGWPRRRWPWPSTLTKLNTLSFRGRFPPPTHTQFLVQQTDERLQQTLNQVGNHFGP